MFKKIAKKTSPKTSFKHRNWNIRHISYKDRFIGTIIYADNNKIGEITSGKEHYQFDIPDTDKVYASVIKLKHTDYIYVLEVQTWGTGPYSRNDLFN